jgi:Ser/Thr protein kinase RdoA (MazF antagonist)
MRWPADHPLITDDRLSIHAGAVESLLDPAATVHALRHVTGRRVTSLVERPDGSPCVPKVFGSPRARGNHRRLVALAATPVAPFVPRPLAVHPDGHAHLVTWDAGTSLDALDDRAFVVACGRLGVVTRCLHASGARLDRTWTLDDELTQLCRRATGRTARHTAAAASSPAVAALAAQPLVPCHRDLHPRQVVVDRDGGVHLIDLDDAAFAPAGLDVGNLVAHLWRETIVAGRTARVVAAAVEALLDGYGQTVRELATWEHLALLRLAGLAESRHRRVDWAVDLLAFADGAVTVA